MGKRPKQPEEMQARSSSVPGDRAEMSGKPKKGLGRKKTKPYAPSPGWSFSDSEYAWIEKAREGLQYQVVAEIAARLLVGDFYADAAKRAIALIDACRYELNERQRKVEIQIRALESARQLGAQAPKLDGKDFQMSYREALEHVTGEPREDRAWPRFKKFLASGIYSKKVHSIVVEIKNKGLFNVTAHRLRLEFEAWDKIDATNRASKAALARGKKPSS